MIDLEKGSEKLDSADGFLTKLKTLLKKHWGILILALVIYFFYWALTSDYDEPTVNSNPNNIKDNTNNDTNETEENYYVIREEYFIDPYGHREGDTVYVDYYNDGHIDQYYTNGEIYIED